MKKLIAILFTLLLILSACGKAMQNPTPIVIVVTVISQAVPASPMPMSTPTPTEVPSPTLTSSPTLISSPTPEPVTVDKLQKALLDNGYLREPFNSQLRPGKVGFQWVKDNLYERILVYSDGYVRLEVLHDKSPDIRSQHMEWKLKILDQIFSSEFMTELRQANDTYNKSVSSSVSGDPAQTWAWHDEWNTVDAQYNVSRTKIESYPVAFALWFEQVTCPSQYSFCDYTDFPGLIFKGQSSIVSYDIEININP